LFISGYAEQLADTLTSHDRLLRKPFSADDLHQAIEALLRERRAVLSGA
jgi:DNA-binding response OmpR family regulator